VAYHGKLKGRDKIGADNHLGNGEVRRRRRPVFIMDFYHFPDYNTSTSAEGGTASKYYPPTSHNDSSSSSRSMKLVAAFK
jgi:hypothetical protein